MGTTISWHVRQAELVRAVVERQHNSAKWGRALLAATGSPKRGWCGVKPNGWVMVVEDDLEIRETLIQIMQEAGYRVTAANNGREALVKLRTGRDEQPSLILLDLMMPVMDGLTFRREQLSDAVLTNIPAVLISAHSNVKESCAELRFAHHLRKPIDLDELLAVTANFCAAS